MSNQYTKHFQSEAWNDLYIDLQADPLNQSTNISFCEQVGIHPRTLYAWKAKYRDDISKEVAKRRDKFKSDFRSDLYKALTARMRGDTAAIKLGFQLLGDLVERSESRVEHMTPADKKAKLKELLSKIGKSSTSDAKQDDDLGL